MIWLRHWRGRRPIPASVLRYSDKRRPARRPPRAPYPRCPIRRTDLLPTGPRPASFITFDVRTHDQRARRRSAIANRGPVGSTQCRARRQRQSTEVACESVTGSESSEGTDRVGGAPPNGCPGTPLPRVRGPISQIADRPPARSLSGDGQGVLLMRREAPCCIPGAAGRDSEEGPWV